MKFLNLIILMLVASCAMNKPKVSRVVTWGDRKRECHTHYLDKFGLNPDGAIGICKEELGRSR